MLRQRGVRRAAGPDATGRADPKVHVRPGRAGSRPRRFSPARLAPKNLGRRRSVRARPGWICSGVPFRPWPERSARSLSLWPGCAGLFSLLPHPGVSPSRPDPALKLQATVLPGARSEPSDGRGLWLSPDGQVYVPCPHFKPAGADIRPTGGPAQPPPPPVRSPAGRPPLAMKRGELCGRFWG